MSAAAARRGVLFDWGGVLTSSIGAGFARFERGSGLPEGRIIALLVAASGDEDGGVIGRFERGELDRPGFERALATLLADDGYPLPADGLYAGLFEGLTPDEPMWQLVDQLRAGGTPVGLVSNSWGMELYPLERLAASFDPVVLSGEVGLRKPDPAIYHLAAERIGLPPQALVFVDDLVPNVVAAERLGMRGVHHRGDAAVTAAAVRAALAGAPSPME